MKKTTARLIVLAVVVMIFLNGTLVLLLWTDKPSPTRLERPQVDEINEFIIREMGFDESTANKFIVISREHHQNQIGFQIRYREIKRKLNNATIAQDKDEAQRLMEDLTAVVKAKEEELYRFFSEVMKITTRKQQEEFGRIFRQATGAPEYGRIPLGGEPNHPPRPKR